jgi:hypothetical protein
LAARCQEGTRSGCSEAPADSRVGLTHLRRARGIRRGSRVRTASNQDSKFAPWVTAGGLFHARRLEDATGDSYGRPTLPPVPASGSVRRGFREGPSGRNSPPCVALPRGVSSRRLETRSRVTLVYPQQVPSALALRFGPNSARNRNTSLIRRISALGLGTTATPRKRAEQ